MQLKKGQKKRAAISAILVILSAHGCSNPSYMRFPFK